MFGRALGQYRRRFAAVLLTCALALIPANAMMAGAVVFGVATLGERKLPDAQPKAEAAPQAGAPGNDAVLRNGVKATEPDLPLFRLLATAAWTVVVYAVFLLLGIALAQAALVPLLLGGARGPAEAWAAVAQRFGALFGTGLGGAALVAAGLVLCVLPGLLAAIFLAFTIPVVMTERLSGRAALERSAMLVKRCWLRVLGLCLLTAAFTALATLVAWRVPAPWQMFVSAAVRVLLYPLPLCALVLLFEESLQPHAPHAIRAQSPAPGGRSRWRLRRA